MLGTGVDKFLTFFLNAEGGGTAIGELTISLSLCFSLQIL